MWRTSRHQCRHARPRRGDFLKDRREFQLHIQLYFGRNGERRLLRERSCRGSAVSCRSTWLMSRRLGIAEADPSLDVDGIDTANKLVIIANSILKPRTCVSLADVDITGIRTISSQQIAEAAQQNQAYRLVASAEPASPPGSWALRVQPLPLPKDGFLGGITGWEMGVVFHSDLFETMWLKIDEPNVVPTACAVLRDIVNVWSKHRPTNT
mmetsp:Transcript_33483/g.78454  ORF Transcript_33483/g.78454 Transcript_33483/m.78454 type:complete len:210 (-) Transcript_33483:152-781(-)